MESIRALQNPGNSSVQNKRTAPQLPQEEPLQEGARPGAIRRAITAIGTGVKLFASGAASALSITGKKTAGIAAAVALSACIVACDKSPTPYFEEHLPDTDTETDTGTTNADTDTDTDTETDTETDSETDTETETDSETDTETETDSETDTETETDSETDTDTDTETETDSETDTDTEDEEYSILVAKGEDFYPLTITTSAANHTCTLMSNAFRMYVDEGAFTISEEYLPFGGFEPESRIGKELFYVTANDAEAQYSLCVLLSGMDISKGMVILKANNGKAYSFSMAQTGNGYMEVPFEYNGQQISFQFYDSKGMGYGTPSGIDEVRIARDSEATYASEATIEVLGVAVKWSPLATIHPAVSPPEGSGVLYNVYTESALFAPGVDGEVLAATSIGDTVAGFTDGSIVPTQEMTPARNMVYYATTSQVRIWFFNQQ